MTLPATPRTALLSAVLALLVTASPVRPEEARVDPTDVRPGTCLSPDEAELARLVQEYRRAHGLPAIPLSKSLTLVAQWHVFDLEKNDPTVRRNEKGQPCGLHSWSSKGPWAGFCYSADTKDEKRIWDKPHELTGGKYPGMGFESVYYNGDGVLPFRALDYWSLRPEERGILLESQPWPSMKWPALGVGIRGRHAALWFGTEKDPLGAISACVEPAAPPAKSKAKTQASRP